MDSSHEINWDQAVWQEINEAVMKEMGHWFRHMG
jgi:hypothetical protein